MKIDALDLTQKIRTLNSAYLTLLSDSNRLLTDVYHAPREGRTYVVLARGFVFWTEDGFDTIHEVREVNYYDGQLCPVPWQYIDYIVESVSGTIVFVGRDRRQVPEDRDEAADWQSIAWRKEAGSQAFSRVVVDADAAWSTTHDLGIMSAGWFGGDQLTGGTEIIAFTTYDKVLHYSLDDGKTWLAQTLSWVASHIHSVWLNPRKGFRDGTARLWIATGDSFDGVGSGVFCTSTLDENDAFDEWEQVWVDRPGYRVVGLTGTDTRIYAGNEAASGGLLMLSNDDYSRANGLWEYGLGRYRFDFHQFRSLLVTDDGVIFSGTDVYGQHSTPHSGQGAYVYVSTDDGASCMDARLPNARRVRSATTDQQAFYFLTDPHYAIGQPLVVYRLEKPDRSKPLTKPYIVKALYAGGESTLAEGDLSPMVDLSAYRHIAVYSDGSGGRVAIDAKPFHNDPEWPPQPDSGDWREIAVLNLNGKQQTRVLPPEATFNMLYRFRVVKGPVTVTDLHFIGRN